jgi:hypothetical protein
MAFCTSCGKPCNYYIIDDKRNFFGFSLHLQKAICTNCGKEIYIDYINDANAETRKEFIRENIFPFIEEMVEKL